MVVKSEKPKKEFVEGHGYTKEDWDAVDSPELTDEELARMRPAKEVLPPAFFEALQEARRTRGRPKTDNAKEAVTLRLPPDVIAEFKAAAGDDWRARMADVLRDAAARQRKAG